MITVSIYWDYMFKSHALRVLCLFCYSFFVVVALSVFFTAFVLYFPYITILFCIVIWSFVFFFCSNFRSIECANSEALLTFAAIDLKLNEERKKKRWI